MVLDDFVSVFEDIWMALVGSGGDVCFNPC